MDDPSPENTKEELFETCNRAEAIRVLKELAFIEQRFKDVTHHTDGTREVSKIYLGWTHKTGRFRVTVIPGDTESRILFGEDRLEDEEPKMVPNWDLKRRLEKWLKNNTSIALVEQTVKRMTGGYGLAHIINETGGVLPWALDDLHRLVDDD